VANCGVLVVVFWPLKIFHNFEIIFGVEGKGWAAAAATADSLRE
jgi:hypothetical protein